ncbi:MAG: hypothetical protein JWQ38_3224 [Flavipsychrobacter sp.]|nr:hypothetical protein [Flavipsychrobacter sp.]
MSDIQKICEEFSKGNFSATYDHLAETIKWKIVGDKTIDGKESMISFCDKMLIEMGASALTNTNIIAEGSHIAIEGSCKYTNDKNEPACVEYCDVYHSGEGKILTITSYCIDSTIQTTIA